MAEVEKEATWAAAVAAAQADPEGAFLLLQRIVEREGDGAGAGAGTAAGFEWELHKENVRPLKRGRNTKLLNRALKAQVDRDLKASLLQTRRYFSLFSRVFFQVPSLRKINHHFLLGSIRIRRMIEAIDEYHGEDPLQPWLE